MGTMSVSNATGYFNAFKTNFIARLAANHPLLFGTYITNALALGILDARVTRHCVSAYQA